MFKRLKTLLLASLGTFALCCGAGFSYWIYSELANRDIKSGAEIEDIYENYNTGKPNPITQYEMYLFPSTWYLSQYKTDKNLPELKYGYIDRSLDENGNIVDKYMIPNSAGILINQSKVPIETTNQYCNDIDTYDAETKGATEYKTFKKPKNNDSEPLFEFNSGKNFPKLYESYMHPSGGKGWDDYGNVEQDLSDDVNVDLNASESSFQETEKDPNNTNQFIGKPIYQKLNIDDRLGYWYDLNVEEGRYLPIKLSFSGSISPETFLKLVSNPRADLGDSNAWHNYAFANWCYYDPNLPSIKKPYEEPVDGFSNYDRANLFDVLNNFETVSVLNKNTGKRVIRLFSTFNNGKDYHETDKMSKIEFGNIKIDSVEFLSKGYRDGLKVEFKTKFKDNNNKIQYRYQTRYFTFEEGDQKQQVSINGVDYNINTATLNNFNTDDNQLTYIDFSGVFSEFKKESEGWWDAKYWYTYDYGNWSNTSGPQFNDLPVNNPLNYNDNKTIFSSGDYNVYALGVDKTYSSRNDIDEAEQDLNSLMGAMLKQEGVNSYVGLSGSIKDKELNKFINKDGNNIIFINGHYRPNDYRAYALFYERILDLKTVINTPVNKIPESDGIYNETSSGALVSHYEKVYDGSRNLFLEDNNFYLGSPSATNKFEFQPDTDESGKPVSVNSKNKFIYKINSLDMTKVDSLFFSIRVEKMYSILSQNVKFNLSPGHDGRMLFENTSGSELTGNGKINGDESNTFVNASEYIEEVQIRGEVPNPDDPNGGTMTSTFKSFKLKEKEGTSPYAYYSFVLVYNPSTYSPFNFDVYAYKQKNLFVKIFNEEPSLYAKGEKKGFLNHEDGEYFYKLYDYNISMDDTDIYSFNKDTSQLMTIGNVFKNYCTERHINENNLGPDFKDPETSVNDNDETYYLIDHVTKIIIAKATYNEVTKDFDIKVNSGTLLNIKKNHVLYVITHYTYENDPYNPLNPASALHN